MFRLFAILILIWSELSFADGNATVLCKILFPAVQTQAELIIELKQINEGIKLYIPQRLVSDLVLIAADHRIFPTNQNYAVAVQKINRLRRTYSYFDGVDEAEWSWFMQVWHVATHTESAYGVLASLGTAHELEELVRRKNVLARQISVEN